MVKKYYQKKSRKRKKNRKKKYSQKRKSKLKDTYVKKEKSIQGNIIDLYIKLSPSTAWHHFLHRDQQAIADSMQQAKSMLRLERLAQHDEHIALVQDAIEKGNINRLYSYTIWSETRGTYTENI